MKIKKCFAEIRQVTAAPPPKSSRLISHIGNTKNSGFRNRPKKDPEHLSNVDIFDG
jgi:hypothetical protein